MGGTPLTGADPEYDERGGGSIEEKCVAEPREFFLKKKYSQNNGI